MNTSSGGGATLRATGTAADDREILSVAAAHRRQVGARLLGGVRVWLRLLRAELLEDLHAANLAVDAFIVWREAVE